MPESETAVVENESPPIRVRVEGRPRAATETKKQPPYAVILHNDPINRFEWVIGVLMKVLRCNGAKAFWLVLKTHLGGRGMIWSGPLEVAELKAEQVRSVGPDPKKVSQGAQPLGVSVEPLAG